MKAVLYLTGPLKDFDKLKSDFPKVAFVTVSSAAEAAKELTEAEIFMTANSLYDAEIGTAMRDKAKKLRWIHFKTSGVENGVEHGMPPKVVVTNSPGMSAPCHAEHAFGMLMMLTRRFRQIDAARAKKQWPRREIGKEMVSLQDKCMVVAGYGFIGQETARLAKAFGMKVIVVSRAAKPGPSVDEVRGRDRLGDSVAEADVVAMCTVLTPDTKAMLGKAEIARMKKTAYLMNMARGALTDEAALIEALKAGRIAGACIDVVSEEPPPADNPFWTLENVVMTPHVSGSGYDSEPRAQGIIRENLTRFVAGQELSYVLGADRLKPGMGTV